MLAIVLSDNIADGDFQGEWGLSIYIEYNGKTSCLILVHLICLYKMQINLENQSKL